MTITTTKLLRAAGLSAVAGGLLFIAVQIKRVAMIGLGYSLWRTTRTEHNDAAIGGHDLRGTSAVAE
jgi:hypothetical protein